MSKIILEVVDGGKIYSAGTYPDFVTATPLVGGTIVELVDDGTVIDPSLYYWNGTAVVAIPANTDPNKTFNYVTHTWEDLTTLAEAKVKQIALIRAEADIKLADGFFIDGVKFASDLPAQTFINTLSQTAAEAIRKDQPFSSTAQDATGQITILSAPAAVRLGQALSAHLESINNYVKVMADEINAASTNAAVYSKVWNMQYIPGVWNKTTFTADGVDSISLSGLPNPAQIQINAPILAGAIPAQTETDGVFDLTSTIAGEYLIIATAPKYYAFTTTIIGI